MGNFPMRPELVKFNEQTEAPPNGRHDGETEKDRFAWFEPKTIPDIPSKPPAQIIEGALYRGAKMSITGGSKERKTWSAMDLAFSVSNGLKWWGIPTILTAVIYLDFELMDFDYEWRASEIRNAKGAGDFKNLRRIGMRGKHMVPQLWDKLITIAQRDGAGFVVIEPQYKLFAGRDENSAGDVAEVLLNFERLAQETGAGTLNTHHHSKGNQSQKEIGDRGSGSGVFFRDVDALFEMVPNKTDSSLSVFTRLRSFPELGDFVVNWKFPLFERDTTGISPNDLRPAKRGGPASKGSAE
jgi:RecA-family ATPase